MAQTDLSPQIGFHRIVLLCAGGMYLGWWLFVRVALPGAFNPFGSRVAVVACFAAVLAATYVSRAVAARVDVWLTVCCSVATLHYFYLFDGNRADINWVVGSYITVMAVCAVLQTARTLLVYSVWVALLSVALLVRQRALPVVVFLPGMLTILLFANVGLRSRLKLLAQVQASHDRVGRLFEAGKRAENSLRLANEELEAFSYSVAHDLRAPLRAIDGFSRVLLEDAAPQLDATAKDYLDRICAAATRMSELIDALLALSRVSRTTLRREPVDVGAVARSVAEQLRTAEPTRSVVFTADEGVPRADADAGLVRVLLENLLGNAWKFTRQRTPVANVAFGVERVGEEDVYFVRDDGAGFEAKYAARLFAPFHRLHSASEFPGTGIGLATVERIVRSHGGRIWADASVGHGATFRFTLPAAPRDAAGERESR